MNNFFKTESEIINWLDSHEIINYKLVKDINYGFVVNVDSDVNLNSAKLDFIPVKFNHIEGHFDCSENKLKNLIGSPQTVASHFWCWGNQLISLEGSPLSVGKDFDCSDNKLDNLEFCPQQIEGSIYCNNNLLTSLKGCIKKIKLGFYCSNNQLSSFEDLPHEVGGNFWCNGNPLLKEFHSVHDFKKFKTLLLVKKLEIGLDDKKQNCVKMKI